jgi:hypothetical protein
MAGKAFSTASPFVSDFKAGLIVVTIMGVPTAMLQGANNAMKNTL